MPGPRWNRYEKNIWQPGWLTEREERRTPGCWKFSGYNLQEGARQIRGNYDNGDDVGMMITIMISLLLIATHQEESYTQWQDASRSAGCSSETWKYRWLDIQSRHIHHHRHHHHHHHNCNALSPAQKWMTLTGTQQRPRPRYSTTARPLMKFYIILSFYIIVQPHTLWRSFCSCERWWCAWWRSSSLFTIYRT